MTDSMRAYYAGREQAERNAAKTCTNPKVRAIHLDLAERYARAAEPRLLRLF